jgi:hypothetical protein
MIPVCFAIGCRGIGEPPQRARGYSGHPRAQACELPQWALRRPGQPTSGKYDCTSNRTSAAQPLPCKMLPRGRKTRRSIKTLPPRDRVHAAALGRKSCPWRERRTASVLRRPTSGLAGSPLTAAIAIVLRPRKCDRQGFRREPAKIRVGRGPRRT